MSIEYTPNSNVVFFFFRDGGCVVGILYEYVVKEKGAKQEDSNCNIKCSSSLSKTKSMSSAEILDFLGNNSMFFVIQDIVKK